SSRACYKQTPTLAEPAFGEAQRVRLILADGQKIGRDMRQAFADIALVQRALLDRLAEFGQPAVNPWIARRVEQHVERRFRSRASYLPAEQQRGQPALR